MSTFDEWRGQDFPPASPSRMSGQESLSLGPTLWKGGLRRCRLSLSTQTGSLFGPKPKVLAIATAGNNDTTNNQNALSPKCFVDGFGCTSTENPNLHSPTTQFLLEFLAPTRSPSGAAQQQQQSIDTTICANPQCWFEDASFLAARTFVHYHWLQDLPFLYREFVELLPPNDDNNNDASRQGRIRVAAFLPPFMAGTRLLEYYYDDQKGPCYFGYTLRLTSIPPKEEFQY